MYIRRPMCLFSLGFLLFLHIIMLLHPDGLKRLHADPLSGFYEKEQLTLYGTVEKKEQKNQKAVIYLKDVSIIRNTTSAENDIQTCRGFILYLSEDDLLYKNMESIRLGSKVKAAGQLRKFEPAENEGQFDARSYYFIRGYAGSLMQTAILKCSTDYGRIRETLYQLREHTKEIFHRHMTEENAGILQALVLGDKTALETDVKELYQNAGIAHILSLSGLHIATVGLCLLKLLRKSGMPIPAAVLISSVIISAYAIMTGLSTSTLRALVMFLLGVFALCVGRTYDLLTAAMLSAMLILIENPYYLYDAGFQLSFGAVLGIGLLCPVMEAGIGKTAGLGVKGILQGLSLSMATQLATLPIVMWNFYQFPRYGIVLNLIVVPLMSILLGLGMAAGLIGNLPMLSACTAFVLKIAEVILNIYEKFADASTRIPGSLWICGKPKLWQAAVYYLVLGAGVIVCSRLRDTIVKRTCRQPIFSRKLRDKTEDGSRNSECHNKQNINSRHKINSRRFYIAKGFIMLGTVVLAVGILAFRNRAEFELHALSVGQGDCSVLLGKETPVILIDGGSTSESQVGKYRILPFLKANAISEIDYVFLSHMDSDHVNGILQLLAEKNSGIKVKRIVIPQAAADMEITDTYMELITLAKEKEIPIYLMKAGDVLTMKELRIACLSPNGQTSWDINDNSLVLLAEYCPSNFKMLFTGDISSRAEQVLLSVLTPVHYLKIAHHGAKTSTSEAFLQKTMPDIVTISAGKDNSYGHPHTETLARLQENEISYLGTIECGEIELLIDRHQIQINTWLCAYP